MTKTRVKVSAALASMMLFTAGTALAQTSQFMELPHGAPYKGSIPAANQMWNGWFFDLQQEYSNHTGTCLQVGP